MERIRNTAGPTDGHIQLIRLDAGEALELVEMLQFLDDWLAGDYQYIGHSFQQFVGRDGYRADDLRIDLQYFVFLLGRSNGDVLFP